MQWVSEKSGRERSLEGKARILSPKTKCLKLSKKHWEIWGECLDQELNPFKLLDLLRTTKNQRTFPMFNENLDNVSLGESWR